MFAQETQRLDVWDLGLTKLSVMCFVLGALAASPPLAGQVRRIPAPLFFLAAFLLGARPTYRFFVGKP